MRRAAPSVRPVLYITDAKYAGAAARDVVSVAYEADSDVADVDVADVDVSDVDVALVDLAHSCTHFVCLL
jgi:hypothetical protein